MNTTNLQRFAETNERIKQYKRLVARIYATTYGDEHIGTHNVNADYGRRFVKISIANRVHTFIDFYNGDILKAASYKAPAKNGVRGNIWSDDLGESVIDHFGAKYLR